MEDLPPLPNNQRDNLDSQGPIQKGVVKKQEMVDLFGDNRSVQVHVDAAIGPVEEKEHSEDKSEIVEAEIDIDDDFDSNEALMDPEHPLMKRVQDALFKQLSSRNDQLELEAKEKEEAVRRAIKKREDIGVELYSVQQQLARLQALLEATEDSSNSMVSFKEEAERKLKFVRQRHKEEEEKLKSHSKNLQLHKQELEKMTKSLKQVELYSEELRSKILVAKRTTLKAEEDIINQEMEKKRQDYFIDSLTSQVSSLQERRALYETQLMAQQKETRAAMETLQDALTEMEAIKYEKRQLIQQWKSSLFGLQRRDETIQKIESEIEKKNSHILNLMGEITGFKNNLRKTAEENEQLSVLLNRLEGEVDLLKRQIGQVNDSKEKLKESYTLYAKSLSQTESELSQVMQERQVLQLEVNGLQKLIQQTVSQTQKIEKEISDHLQSQMSLEKGAQGTRKDAGKLSALIHSKEAHIAQVENELSQVNLESLNVTQRISSIKVNLAKLEQDIKGKNNTIEQYEIEIRRRNDELGKKQSEIDLLNKKYDQLAGKNLDESRGPLEATIHNLSKLIDTKEKECGQLQQYWLKIQNELVVYSKKSSDISEDIQDLSLKLSVLARKKMVVNGQFETEEKEMKEHQREIKKLQNDMVKVNTILCKQTSVQSQLEESNLGLEIEFRARLKQAEIDSIHMEQDVDRLKDEKEKALQGLIEAERQMMLWEKKIQLAKETQAALDPNIGATEIREMTAEIHRMKLRYNSMLKVQERMIADMEKSVFRRESIATRTKAKGKGGGQMLLQKTIADLGKKIRQTAYDIKECEKDIESLFQAKQNISSQIEESTESCHGLEDKERNLLIDLEESMVKKSVYIGDTMLHQKGSRRFEEACKDKYVYLIRDPVARNLELIRQQERFRKLVGLVKLMQLSTPPHVTILFKHVEELFGKQQTYL